MELSLDNRVTEELLRAKENDRLSHVYLFYGDDSKTMLDEALYFAASLYCGCLECQICNNIINGNHLNVKVINILPDKTMITKEQISDLEEEFGLTSLVDGPRIYIINGIDTASISAQNSLLKFIEEPNNKDEVYGILIANDLNNVLTTIKSRCALMRFMPRTFEQTKEELNKEFNLDDAFILACISTNINVCKDFFKEEKYNDLKSLILDFIKIDNQKNAVLFYMNYKNIDKFVLGLFLKVLINIYHESLTIHKLISSTIYDKIIMLKQNYNKNILENNFELLLNLETKLKYNVVEKNILHELIVSFF